MATRNLLDSLEDTDHKDEPAFPVIPCCEYCMVNNVKELFNIYAFARNIHCVLIDSLVLYVLVSQNVMSLSIKCKLVK